MSTVNELREYAAYETKRSANNVVRNVPGGLFDTTFGNIYHTVVETVKGPVKRVIDSISQPISQGVLMLKEAFSVRPGKSASRRILGRSHW